MPQGVGYKKRSSASSERLKRRAAREAAASKKRSGASKKPNVKLDVNAAKTRADYLLGGTSVVAKKVATKSGASAPTGPKGMAAVQKDIMAIGSKYGGKVRKAVKGSGKPASKTASKTASKPATKPTAKGDYTGLTRASTQASMRGAPKPATKPTRRKDYTGLTRSSTEASLRGAKKSVSSPSAKKAVKTNQKKAEAKAKSYSVNGVPVVDKSTQAKKTGRYAGGGPSIGRTVKRVLLGKDEKFGGDKGLIDFVRVGKKKK